MSETPVSSPQPIIEMNGVTVPSAHKPNALSVRNVHWRVSPGDFWVVAGLEHAGKSDLLMMTGGLLPPVGGTYRLFGETMPIFEGERLATRLRLGLVFDDGRLFNQLTIAENVALPMRYHLDMSASEANDAVLHILELTELSPWANHRPGAMGWGWQKRAALARAIALQPELLLLDDPLRGLDARHTSWWLAFLDRLSSDSDFMRGRTVTLVVTAGALDVWKNRARQFAVLQDRQFIMLGTRDQLSHSKSSIATEFLSNAMNI